MGTNAAARLPNACPARARWNSRDLACVAASTCALVLTASGGEPATNRAARVQTDFVARVDQYRANTNVLVRPGLVADRAARKVVIDAEATGLKTNDTAEFWLIGPDSGHAYEALAVSWAKASDVRAALEFIGMTPGQPFAPDKLRFWPKGERVRMGLEFQVPGAPPRRVAAEQLILDKATGNPLREAGFVFVGSRHIEAEGKRFLVADERDPRSIASNYNETDTLLDVPRQAPQGEVYESHVVSGAAALPAGLPLRIALQPEYPAGKSRVVDLALRAVPRAADATNSLAGVAFTLRGAGREYPAASPMQDILATFSGLVQNGQDPFVAVDLAPELRLNAIAELCRVLAAVEGENGIRVEPPPAGTLYYRAFLANERFRSRAARIAQPWELALTRGANGTLTATLTDVEQSWRDDRIEPDLKVKTEPVASPEALRAALTSREGLAVVLVFADPSLTYAELLSFVQPILPTHPTVHVYLGPARE